MRATRPQSLDGDDSNSRNPNTSPGSCSVTHTNDSSPAATRTLTPTAPAPTPAVAAAGGSGTPSRSTQPRLSSEGGGDNYLPFEKEDSSGGAAGSVALGGAGAGVDTGAAAAAATGRGGATELIGPWGRGTPEDELRAEQAAKGEEGGSSEEMQAQVPPEPDAGNGVR